MFKLVQERVKMVIVALFIMLFVSGCIASQEGAKPVVDNTYKILKTTQIGYDNSMKAVAALYQQGKISEAQKDKVVAVAKDFVASYKLVARALEMFADGTANQITVDEAVNNFVEIQIRFVNLVREVVANEY